MDGNVIRTRNLESKPAPDTILVACELLGVQPNQAAVFETTTDGLEASRSATVAVAIGVDRAGRAEVLHTHGAQLVVSDLVDLLDTRA